jgi:hypothetical protein
MFTNVTGVVQQACVTGSKSNPQSGGTRLGFTVIANLPFERISMRTGVPVKEVGVYDMNNTSQACKLVGLEELINCPDLDEDTKLAIKEGFSPDCLRNECGITRASPDKLATGHEIIIVIKSVINGQFRFAIDVPAYDFCSTTIRIDNANCKKTIAEIVRLDIASDVGSLGGDMLTRIFNGTRNSVNILLDLCPDINFDTNTGEEFMDIVINKLKNVCLIVDIQEVVSEQSVPRAKLEGNDEDNECFADGRPNNLPYGGMPKELAKLRGIPFEESENFDEFVEKWMKDNMLDSEIAAYSYLT